MYVFEQNTAELRRWIRDEVEIERPLARGARGMAARRLQEWLNLHRFGIATDGDFGPITERALRHFQESAGLPATGAVDGETHGRLVAPMIEVLGRRPAVAQDLGTVAVDYARQHLARHPLEVGGQNRGPWVRLYMQGYEGTPWAWCAGFVCFLLRQAAQTLGVAMPVGGSFSCDSLAAQARAAGRFLPESEARDGRLAAGSLFLVRRTATDWTHTGLVTAADEESFDTIEGNTNDDGEREGYEVCARTRGYLSKDFVLVA
jgi:hypothetical protein